MAPPPIPQTRVRNKKLRLSALSHRVRPDFIIGRPLQLDKPSCLPVTSRQREPAAKEAGDEKAVASSGGSGGAGAAGGDGSGGLCPQGGGDGESRPDSGGGGARC